MERKITAVLQNTGQVTIPDKFHTDPDTWLVEQSQAYNLRWLLAHADDGVIWGEVREDKLWLSSNAFSKVSPPLRAITLQQMRLFGKNGELLLWRTDNGFTGRLLLDEQGTKVVEYFEEPHLLWGTYVEDVQAGFSLLCEGQQGLRHAVPLTLDKGDLKERIRLRIRHYLAKDKDGQVYINMSRLVKIGQSQGGKV